MSANLPTIIKASESLLDAVERTVPAFPRKYRDHLVKDIRGEAIAGALLAQQAMMAREAQAQVLRKLSASNDKLKLQLQTAHRLQCFRSRGEFEVLAELAFSVGRQCGALLKAAAAKHPHGQSAGASAPPAASRDTEYSRHPTGVNA